MIVPVYKVEKYLDRCIESIVSQTYTDLEIILVDDGSPDHCPEMCDSWSKKDSRIIVIHKENGGLSDARNTGVRQATGTYVAFVDSDDWIDHDMYSKLYCCIKSTESDIASCGALRVWENGGPQYQLMLHVDKECVLNRSEAMQALIQSTVIIQTVWNKLYKTELIKNIPFEKGKIHEDEYWSWQVIAKASSVAILKDNLYMYFQRDNSIMGNGYTGSPMNIIEAKWQRHCYIKENMPELEGIETVDFLFTCRYECCQILKNESPETQNTYIARMKELIKKTKKSIVYLGSIPVKKVIRAFLIQILFIPVCKIEVLLGIQ